MRLVNNKPSWAFDPRQGCETRVTNFSVQAEDGSIYGSRLNYLAMPAEVERLAKEAAQRIARHEARREQR